MSTPKLPDLMSAATGTSQSSRRHRGSSPAARGTRSRQISGDLEQQLPLDEPIQDDADDKDSIGSLPDLPKRQKIPLKDFSPSSPLGLGERSAGASIPLGEDAVSEIYPPSFAESQFQTIVRRQISRPKDGGGTKISKVASRYPNLPNRFEFAGWGSLSYVELTEVELKEAEGRLKAMDKRVLGAWRASGLAANALLGSIIYALPSVVAHSGTYAPLSFFIATLLLFAYRPVMVELASAFPVGGANYAYLLNITGKTFALAAATLTLLDNIATAVVSAASAAVYISGEINLPFATFVLAIFVIIGFSIITLAGVRDSAGLAFAIIMLHVLTMSVLAVAAVVTWAKNGNGVLKANWSDGQPNGGGFGSIARAIFDGSCLALLGLTGFECAPNFISSIKPNRFPSVLRNLHYPAIILNGPMMLLILAVLPLSTITSGTNVFSSFGEVAGGKWLRIWVVVDVVIVLCAGVLTAIIGAGALVERLTMDRVLPKALLWEVPGTGALGVTIAGFSGLCCLLYATSGFSLTVVSSMFSVTFLCVMFLFAICLLSLKFNRSQLARSPRASLKLVFFTISISAVVLAGNIVLSPRAFGLFAAYFIGVFAVLWVCKEPVGLLKFLCWIVDQAPGLRRGRLTTWGPNMVKRIEKLRKPPVCCLVKSDEIDRLFRQISYVSRSEATSNVKLLHFHERIEDVPKELEANAQIIDEAFPMITVDLVFVQSAFTPAALEAVSKRLGIDRSLFFMTCPGENLGYTLYDLGTRIVCD